MRSIKGLNPIIFKIINGTLVLLIFISWIKIASLNWVVPEWVRTLQLVHRYSMEELFSNLNNMSISFIRINFIPFFVLFFISVIIFFIMNIKKRTTNHIEEISIKIIFSAIILSSLLFILVFNIPNSIGFLGVILDFTPVGSVTNWELIEFYFNCLSVINFILICVSIVGLLLLCELNIKSKIENFILKGHAFFKPLNIL
ncbi:MAG: hypothetical protein ACFFCY_03295 [Promethearchaeota archaeon]